MSKKADNSIYGVNPKWLVVGGVRSLAVIAMAGVAALGIWFYTATAGLTIPLIIAAILGVLFYRVVERLQRLRLPKALATTIVVLGLFAAAIGVIWIMVVGILQQGPLIVEQVQAGLQNLETWLHSLDLPPSTVKQMTESVNAAGPKMAQGLASALGSSLSGAGSFLFGVFLGTFMLVYILNDFDNISRWIGGHIGLDQETGTAVVLDAALALRQYFVGVTISGLIVTAVISLGLIVMKVPLVLPIALVTFMTAYIPYFGAIISAVFACLVALGSGGVQAALVVLVVILLAQNVIQTIVQNQISSEKLSIHPLAGLIATILGGTFLGLLGSILGQPSVAIAMRTGRHISASREREAAAETGELATESA